MKQAYSAEVASGSSGSKGSNSDYGGEHEQGTQLKSEESESSSGRGYTRGRGRGLFRGRGRTDGAPCCGGHQMSFCKTEVNKESQDGIESIYQNKIDSSLNSDSKVREGVCYFLKSRLPTSEGTVNGRNVEVLHDAGCTCCTVKRSLVSDDQLKGKESNVALIDETKQRHPLAVIDIDCPFSLEKLRLCAWTIHCMSLLLEMLMDQNFLICHTFQLRLLLDIRLSKMKRHIGNFFFFFFLVFPFHFI